MIYQVITRDLHRNIYYKVSKVKKKEKYTKKIVLLAGEILLLVWAVTFPIFELYSHNIKEVSIKEIIPILVVYSLLFISAFLILYKRISIKKIIYLFFLFNILSIIYGNIIIYLEKYIGQIEYYRDLQMIPVVIILIIFLSRKYGQKTFGFVKLFLLVSLVYTGYGIISNTRLNNSQNINTEINLKTSTKESINTPDIYYFILDEFASSDTIRDYYDHDNTAFEKNLRERGFIVMNQSTSEFRSTWSNLSSILNLEKIDDKMPAKEKYESIINNKVANILKHYGYKYIYISDQPLYYGSDNNPYSDYSLYDYKKEEKDRGIAEYKINKFIEMFLKSTIFRPLLTKSSNNIYRENELLKHVMLEEVVERIDSPKFVFLHSMITHEPFLFNQSGGRVDYSKQNNWNDKSIYLDSYIYAKAVILNDVDEIRSAGGDYIIIVQSDHGPKPEAFGDEWKKTFSAVYINPKYQINLPKENFRNIDTFKTILKIFEE